MGVVYLARCTKLKRDVAFLLMGKKIEAIKLFDQAISLESGWQFGLHVGAIKEAELGNIEKGLRLARKWETTNPYDSEVWYKIANTYALRGEKERCMRALKRTIEEGFFVILI